jgi:hypothetical protein
MKYKDVEIISAGYSEEEQLHRRIFTDFAWNLVDVCNYKCTYCNMGYGNDSTRPKSSFFKDTKIQEAWRTVIDKLNHSCMPDFVVSLLGGEPTLHPNILEIITELESIKRCVSFDMITNATRPFSFFKELSSRELTKLNISTSIHFEHAPRNLVDKILRIHNETNIEVSPVVMLHDNKKYWPAALTFLKTCVNENIKYSATLLENAYGYTPKYTREFYDTFSDYLPHGFMKALIARKMVACDSSPGENYQIGTKDKQTHNISIRDIYTNNIRQFEGWRCTPKSWLIGPQGDIINPCTNEQLNVTNSNINCQVKCPKKLCNHKSLWNYEKFKN